MVKIFGVRKEDEVYYQGAFWIVGDSVRDIKRGNFEIIGIQIASDYKGTILKLFLLNQVQPIKVYGIGSLNGR